MNRQSNPITTPKAPPSRPSAESLLFGAVLRPPRYQLLNGRFSCSRLSRIDRSEMPESARVVTQGDFVAVIAEDIHTARLAASRLKATWEPPPTNSAKRDESSTWVQPAARARQLDRSTGAERQERRYGWPNRLRWGSHADWVIASPMDTGWQIWAPSQSPDQLRRDLAALLDCEPIRIEIFGAAMSSISRTCADDAAADAALLARETGRPVAVWLSSDYQSVVDSLGPAQQIKASAACSNGSISNFDYRVQQAWNSAPALALLLAGVQVPACNPPAPPVDSPYDFGTQRILEPHATESAYRSSEQAGLQDSFARESFIDELAESLGEDPLALRLRHLRDDRGRALLESVATQAGWQEDASRGLAPAQQQDIARGRGIAYAHTPVPGDDGNRGTRSAWIADIEVNQVTGDVKLNRIVVGQDSGEAVDSERLRNQLQHELLAQDGPLLLRRERWDQWATGSSVDTDTTSVEVAAPLAHPSAMPALSDVPETPALRCDEGLMHPAVAALANALDHATGIRLREPPFSADRIRGCFSEGTAANTDKPKRRGLGAAIVASAIGALAIGWPWKGAIEPIPRPAPDLYSAATIERGRLVAEAGDCAVCHTELNGEHNAGGRPFETPFGILYSTNITPDEKTGIGNWSFAAFDRAMRHGVSRDGRQLYPAFPYTAFAKITDSDMQALYAYLMAQPAVRAETPAPEMNFPFSYRPLLAGWNALFHDPKPFQPNPERSELWNRGAYLAEGLGHCSACHSPRNALGAEKIGMDYFAGAMVDGWEAPPLNKLSNAPVPWTEEALFQYLREGKSDQHGAAAGPMAPVVAGLAQLPEKDVRAIAHYVASFSTQDTAIEANSASLADTIRQQTTITAAGLSNGARLYESGCAACHEERDLRAFTDAQTSLALNSNLHSDQPDNLIQTILYGVQARSLDLPDIGMMPGFKNSLSDDQITDLVSYLRQRFAPGKAMWKDVAIKVAHYRQHEGTH